MTAFGFIFDIKPRTEGDRASLLNKIITPDLVPQKESCKKISSSTSEAIPIISTEVHGVNE